MKAPAWRRSRFWALRIVRWGGGLLAGLLLLVLLVLALPAGREFVLTRLLDRVGGQLPGQLTIDSVKWPDPGSIRLRGIAWTAPDSVATADTLLTMDQLGLDVALGDLARRRLGIRRVTVQARQLDVPGIMQLFPAAAPDTTAAGPARVPFFREGAWPDLPAAYLDTLELSVQHLALPDSVFLHDLSLRAGGDLRPENSARAWLDPVALRVTAYLPDPVPLALDQLRLEFTQSAPEETAEAAQARISAHFTLPGPDRWPGLSPQAKQAALAAQQDAADDCQGRLEAQLGLGPALQSLARARLDLDLAQTAWLDRGRFNARYQGGQVLLDTLDVALLGAEFMAHGTADTTRLDLDFSLQLAEGHRLNALLGPEYAAYQVTTDAQGNLSGPLRRPDLQLDLLAGLLAPDLHIPRLAAQAAATDDSLRLSLDADRGLTLSTVALDSLRARWRAGRPDQPADLVTAAHAFALQAWSRDRSLGLGGRLTGDTVRTLQLDSLRVRVQDEEARLARPMTLSFDQQERWLTLDGQLLLPGPADWPDLPAQAGALAEAEDSRGRLQARVKVGPELNTIEEAQVRMDLGQSAWLDRGVISGSYLPGRVLVDSLDLALQGAGLMVSGTADTQQVDLDFSLDIAEDHQLHRFLGQEYRDYQAHGQIQGHLAGPVRRPELDLSLDAALDIPELSMPRLQIDGRAGADSLTVTVLADQQFLVGIQPVDSMRAHYATIRPEAPDWKLAAPQSFQVQARSRELDLDLAGVAQGDTLRTLQLDSLRVRIQDQIARLARPLVLTYDPEDRAVSVEGLDFVGDPGHLALGGFLSPAGIDLTSTWDLRFTEEMLQTLAPSEIWSRNEGMDILLEGNADLKGTPSGPRFAGGFLAAMEPHGSDPPLSAEARFKLGHGDSTGLAADLRLQSGELLLLQGRALWPGQANLATGTWAPDSTAGPRLDFPDQKVDLARLKTLFPGTFSLDGFLGVALNLGSPEHQESRWKGRIYTPGVEVELPNSSRIDLEMDCQVDGPALDPAVTGSIKVASGFFRIPELPRNLLPVEGSSLLWAARDSTQLALESAAQADQGPVLQAAKPPYLPDLDVDISVPGGLVIHGYGLSVELEGQLKVTRGVDPDGFSAPSLEGYVGVRQGSLQFMNRVFDFTQAEILFRNQVPANPRLNVNMESEVGSYLVRIEIRGTGLEPDIRLMSEPELQQSDIMALLLFGQTSSDLDTDQRGRMQQESTPAQQLQQNLAALAVVFGTSGMQNTVSSTLGVDMVEFGSDSQGESTLMVGKYLSPRILVKYHQSLEKSGTYFMTLDYSINKFFKLVSTYGQGEEDSGLELKWTRRY